MGIYATAAEVRAEPEVPDAAADVDVEARIAQAEEWIDGKIAYLPIQDVGPSLGRRIVEADVGAIAWTKIKRATIRLAARLWENPKVLQPPAYGSVSGPDFSRSGPASVASRIPDVIEPLNASGLRITGARAAP